MCIIKNGGEVAEWSKANDSKSFNRKLFVGSNPTLSVFYTNKMWSESVRMSIMTGMTELF